jgi:predicted metalloprotease with PDZ domain
MVSRRRDKVAVALFVGAFVAIGIFVLADRRFEFELSGKRSELAAIALDAAVGATVEPFQRDMARSLGVDPPDKGLVITSLERNGPAARAGIRAGDVIERIGGVPVGSIDEAASALKAGPPPGTILMLNRHGEYVIVHLPIRSSAATRDLAKQGRER